MNIIGRDLEEIQVMTKTDPNQLSLLDWELRFARWAKITQHLMPYFDREKFISLLIEKNSVYGDGPIKKWGELGVAIRISSKYERYANLNKGSLETWGDETVTDTVTDLIGYCVLGIIYVRGLKHGHDFWLDSPAVPAEGLQSYKDFSGTI